MRRLYLAACMRLSVIYWQYEELFLKWFFAHLFLCFCLLLFPAQVCVLVAPFMFVDNMKMKAKTICQSCKTGMIQVRHNEFLYCWVVMVVYGVFSIKFQI